MAGKRSRDEGRTSSPTIADGGEEKSWDALSTETPASRREEGGEKKTVDAGGEETSSHGRAMAPVRSPSPPRSPPVFSWHAAAMAGAPEAYSWHARAMATRRIPSPPASPREEEREECVGHAIADEEPQAKRRRQDEGLVVSGSSSILPVEEDDLTEESGEDSDIDDWVVEDYKTKQIAKFAKNKPRLLDRYEPGFYRNKWMLSWLNLQKKGKISALLLKLFHKCCQPQSFCRILGSRQGPQRRLLLLLQGYKNLKLKFRQRGKVLQH